MIAWQTINAVRYPNSKRFTRGFLNVAPGIAIRDRLRVLLPNDPDSYYASRELIPTDLLPELGRARVIDLSATPFFLRGSGYAEGTRFPWTMSDFSLMDAIECGMHEAGDAPFCRRQENGRR